MDPSGKVALVTGGASGIGSVTCEELLNHKVKVVVVCDVDSKLGKEREEKLKKTHGSDRVVFIQVDVRNYDRLEEVFKQVKRTYGQLDIVFNNAGVLDDKNWEREVDINVNGVIRCLLIAFKYMGKSNGESGEGVVVNTASLAGLLIHDCMPIYSATKHAVVGLTKAFGTTRHFDETGVRVVAICPGYTKSSFGIAAKNLVKEDWLPDLLNIGTPQGPDVVSRSVLHMIREAPNGSIWVCDQGEPAYQIVMPPVPSMKV